MRLSTSIKAFRIAACVSTALTLLVLSSAPPAGASEASNPFAGAAGATPAGQARKPTGASNSAGASGHAAQSGGASSQAATSARSPTVNLSPAAKAKLLQAAKSKLSQQAVGTRKATSPLPAATTATTETSSKTSTPMILALIVGGLVLGGIAFVIVRDARSVAPVVEGLVTGGTRNPEGRLRKRRAQAKAARRQRKRHRKR